MYKKYDLLCDDCEGCALFGSGVYPNGAPFVCCNEYGYILHPERGIVHEHCKGFRSPLEKAPELNRAMSLRMMKK